LDDLVAPFGRASGQQACTVVCMGIGLELSKLALVCDQLLAETSARVTADHPSQYLWRDRRLRNVISAATIQSASVQQPQIVHRPRGSRTAPDMP
jgi:hypothetical protein